MKFYEHQTVVTITDFPKNNIKSGDIGVVVAIFTDPNEAYEVEFVNADGSTKAMFAILPEHLEEA
jgi:hypothetical protein